MLLLLWAAGLGAFGMRVANSTPAADPPNADGIVALTGAASVRIEAAVQLLEDGKAQRLLVSGVNPDVTRPELQAVAHDFGRAFNCCVDLGFHAANTQGNARETANWVGYHHYRSLIVVTSDYHIPARHAGVARRHAGGEALIPIRWPARGWTPTVGGRPARACGGCRWNTANTW